MTISSETLDAAAGNGVAEDADNSAEIFATVKSASVSETSEGADLDTPMASSVESATETVDNSLDQIDSGSADVEIPAVTLDLSGITEDGRAINDPRVDAKPVTEINVETAKRALFNAEAFPDAVQIANSPERAANDPRGPRANDAAEDVDSDENNVQEA
jgi:ribonuclease E